MQANGIQLRKKILKTISVTENTSSQQRFLNIGLVQGNWFGSRIYITQKIH